MAQSEDDIGPWISFDEAFNLVNAPGPIFSALVSSGLLGYSQNQKLNRKHVLHFVTYGTQWDAALGERLFPEELFIDQPYVDGKSQPLGSSLEAQIRSKSSQDTEPDDEGWIAQFYLIPNRFFFPDPACFSTFLPRQPLIGKARTIIYEGKQIILFPNAQGHFAMIMVLAPNSKDSSIAFGTCYDAIGPLLDELSFEFEVALHISHSILIGVPSGIIQTRMNKIASQSSIPDSYQFRIGNPLNELREATALYREAISSNNTFHQFLTYWKVYENASEIRCLWRQSKGLHKSDRRLDKIEIEEQLPDFFVFGDLVGKSFGSVRETLRPIYRNAVAHGFLDAGIKPKTALFDRDVSSVSNQIAIVRYMAKVIIKNVSKTMSS